MRRKAQLSFGGLVLAVLALFLGPALWEGETTPALGTGTASSESAPHARSSAPAARDGRADDARASSAVGFRTAALLREHFEKHGREFGVTSAEAYLRLAQELRDAPTGAGVLERVRADGVITRFDVRSGAFLAFNADGSLRTFFKPNDGRAYFERQAQRDER